MRKLLLAFCAFATICSAGAQWKPAGDKIKTDWAEKVDPRNVLPEYPRPGMERADWQNLNGEWEYAILPKGHTCLARSASAVSRTRRSCSCSRNRDV